MLMLRRTTSLELRLGALLVALLLAAPLQAQTYRARARSSRPAAYQMEIYNGASRTVRNFANDLSPGETASLSDLERLENEASFAQEVLALKNQYVSGERLLEPQRRLVQQELYGRTITQTNFGALTTGVGYGYGYGSPAYAVGGFGYYRPAAYGTAIAGERSTETRSLADGVGDEGVLKTALAGVIAKQAVPGYAATVTKDYRAAISDAALSPRLQAGLSLPGTDVVRKENNAIRAAEFETPASDRVTLTLMNGKKIVGTTLDEGKEWITIKRQDGGTSRFRLSQVVQIDMPTTGGGKVAPAADD